ncbi:TPA: phage integrase Arm DNA-binding domain-containing protein [Vibrio parahaemolyticus]
MARPRKDSIDVPNLYRKKDKRNGKVYYQYKNQVTGRFVSWVLTRIRRSKARLKPIAL